MSHRVLPCCHRMRNPAKCLPMKLISKLHAPPRDAEKQALASYGSEGSRFNSWRMRHSKSPKFQAFCGGSCDFSVRSSQTVCEYVFRPVRPSSGAEKLEKDSVNEVSNPLELAEVAADEDGRSPASRNICEAGVDSHATLPRPVAQTNRLPIS